MLSLYLAIHEFYFDCIFVAVFSLYLSTPKTHLLSLENSQHAHFSPGLVNLVATKFQSLSIDRHTLYSVLHLFHIIFDPLRTGIIYSSGSCDVASRSL